MYSEQEKELKKQKGHSTPPWTNAVGNEAPRHAPNPRRIPSRIRLAASLLLTYPLLATGPDNDAFDHRATLTGSDVLVPVYLLDASTEPGEPNHALPPAQSYASTWWTWTAPGDGNVSLSHENRDVTLTIYRGDTLATLQVVNRSQEWSRSLPLIPVQAGDRLQLVASVWSTSSTAPVVTSVGHFRLQFYPPPANDSFQDRGRLSGLLPVLRGNLAGATREPGEPDHADVPRTPNGSLWWEWTPPVDGLVSARTEMGSPGELWWYRGTSVDTLTLVSRSNPDPALSVKAGETLQVAMVGYSPEFAGPFQVGLTLSTLRVLSPTNGTVLPNTGPLTLRLGNAPAGLVRVEVQEINGPFKAFEGSGPELMLPDPGPGPHRWRVMGFDAEGRAHVAPEVHVTLGAGADAFAAAVDVGPNDLDHPTVLGGDFATATFEPGEPAPDYGGLPRSGSVWWRWKAPGPGRVLVGAGSLPPGTALTTFDAFTGPNLTQLQPVPFIGNSAPPNLSTAFLTTGPGTFWLRLLRLEAPPYGWAMTQFAFQARAEGDDFADGTALDLSGADSPIPHTLATDEPGEPGTTAFEAGSRWYHLRPPADGRLRLQLQYLGVSSERLAVQVFSGDRLDQLQPLSPEGLDVDVPVTAGVAYHVRLLARNDLPAYAQLVLRAAYRSLPSNDALARAIEIPATPFGSLSGSTDLATRDAEQPPNLPGDRSVWYRFTAPTAGSLVVEARPGDTDPFALPPDVGFLTGDSPASLIWVDRQFHQGARGSVDLVDGESVILSVWSQGSMPAQPSRFVLEHRFVPRPPNDAFAQRTRLEGHTLETRGTNWTATAESDEPIVVEGGSQRTIWWEWTAPESGFLDLRSPVPLALFRGPSLTHLVRQPLADATNALFDGQRFAVTAGVPYILAADRRDPPGPVNPFEPGGLDGFEVSGSLSSLALASPTNSSVLTSTEPVRLALLPLDPKLDPDVVSVSYRRILPAASGAFTSMELGTAAHPPFAVEVMGLAAGRHQVQASATLASGEVRVSPVLAFRIAPANDAFANATVLEGRQLTHAVVWSGGTFEVGEPSGAAAGSTTVWYRWVAPAAGTLGLSVDSGATVHVLTGTNLASLKVVSRLAGAPPAYSVTAGTQYFFRVSGPIEPTGKTLTGTLRLSLSTGSIIVPQENALIAAGAPISISLGTTAATNTLVAVRFRADAESTPFAVLTAPPWTTSWTNATSGRHTIVAQLDFVGGETETTATRTFIVSPANDRFTNRIVLEGGSGQVTGQSRGATSDLGGANVGEVWFDWTAPVDGLLHIQTTALPGLTDVRLYTGTNLTSLLIHPSRPNAQGNPTSNDWKVEPGTCYHIAVLQSAPTTFGGAFDFRWTFLPRTTHDAFADRLPLEGESGVASGSLSLATLEPGEPAYAADYPVKASIWWTWTPPRSGLLRLSFPDDNAPPTSVRPFLGDSLGALKAVPAMGTPSPWDARPRYHAVTAGVPVQLAYISGLDNVADRRFRWELLPLPTNDAYENRLVLGPTDTVIPGSTVGARVSASDPFPSEQLIGNVWWTWVAPADGDLVLGLRGLRSQQALVLFRGTRVTALELLQSQYVGPETLGRSPVPVVAGQTYQVMVGSLEFPGDAFQLELQLRTRPANDNFARRQRVNGVVARLSGNNWRASREFLEPIHGGRFGGRSVWYAWRAPSAGRVTVHPVEAELPFVLAGVYTGETVDALQPVVAGELTGQTSTLSFEAQAGQDYALVVDGANGFTTEFTLDLSLATVLAPPQLTPSLASDGRLQLATTPLPPGNWVLESSADLRDWSEPEPIATGSIPTVSVPNGITSRFYRLRRVD